MKIDALTSFWWETALTASARSSIVDQKAANVAIGNELWVEFLVTTALDSSGEAATLVLTLQGDSDEAFGTAVTLYTTGTITEATLVAGYKVRFKVPIDTGYRYLALYATVGTENFTSGNVSGYLVETPYER